MNTKGLLIKKHSAIIQCSVKELTLMQRKMINGLIYIAQKNPENEIFEVNAEHLKKICGFNLESNSYMQEQLRKIKDISFEFNYFEKDKKEVWSYFDLLSEVNFEFGSGKIRFAFPPTLRKNILNPYMYAPLNIILIAGLKCSYAIVIYEFLRDYLTAPSIPLMTIEDIRNLLGLKDGEYKLFQNFKVRVLKPAVEEVNKNTDICCHYELIKEKGVGNRYTHIQFFASKKTEVQDCENNEDVIKMGLFDNAAIRVDKPISRILEEVLAVIPDKQRTAVVSEILSGFIEKGAEYLISNIKYSLKKSKDNFPAYLRQALENDYAVHERDVKINIEKNKKEESKQKEEKEQKVKKEKIEFEEFKNFIEKLPSKKYAELERKATETLKTREPNNPYVVNKTSIMIEMVRIYKDNDAQYFNYSGKDYE